MSKTDNFDLASLDAKAACEKGYELELRHPVSNVPLGVFITVVGSESDAFQDHVRRKANERLRQDFAAQRKGKENVPTVEQAEKDGIDLIVACVTGWRTGGERVIQLGPDKLECTEANARTVFTSLRWARDQVAEAIGDLGNFMPD
jgi:hypothetical protein